MRDSVLLVSTDDDLNVFRIKSVLDRRGVLNHFADPAIQSTNFHLESTDRGFALQFANGSRANSCDIGAVWTRGFNYTRGFDVHQNSSENRIRHEKVYAYESIWNLLDDRVWVNSLRSTRRFANRLVQKPLAQSVGFNVPDWIVTQSVDSARDFIRAHGGRAVIKLLSQGGVAELGTANVMTTRIGEIDLSNWSDSAPVLLEQFVDKLFELRVAVVGSDIYAGALDTSKSDETSVDSRCWVRSDLFYYPVNLDSCLKDKLIELNDKMGLVYSSFDIGVDREGRHFFFEANPSGQWTFLEAQTGHPISESIANQLVKGLDR